LISPVAECHFADHGTEPATCRILVAKYPQTPDVDLWVVMSCSRMGAHKVSEDRIASVVRVKYGSRMFL
jgi:hypothetical protein